MALKTFTIEHKLNCTFGTTLTTLPVRVCDWSKELESNFVMQNIINPDEVINNNKKIILNFDYPFENPQTVECVNRKSSCFNRLELYECIYITLKNAYIEEEHNKQIYNQPLYDLNIPFENLVIESIDEVAEGTFDINIGYEEY